ncbi:hypothetical protein DICPUDRAFT_150853 [Dictyostelium purpureum]|uniref:GYF domain-containing protein n=1 Tax=Dictyostelium purpureum TaxID=5786 RepID=F0ZHF0_DICPU|nr:uncharacterized protein DICPUDRAFT_150853 [Dictyostelium purpureum]EGC36603.1 hypothetical protein DICPUDRAFT_150853 [Dictyostelium purpureum]|eukprot:XP_003286841.1 hypothetical protein DICPUDRAFT_150853 [Dictyostelium purpureum]
MSINRQSFNQQSPVSPIKNQMNSSPTPDSIFMQQPTGNPTNRVGQNGVATNGMMNGGGINTNFASNSSLPSTSRWAGVPNQQQQQQSPQNNYQYGFSQQPQQTNKLNNSNNSISYGQQSPQPQLRRSSEFSGWNSYSNNSNKMNSMMKAPTGGSNSSSLSNSSNGLGSGGSKTKYSKDELLNLYDPMAKIPENLISHTHILSEEVQQPINFSFDNNLSKSRDRARMGGVGNMMNRGVRKDMSHDRMKKYSPSSSQSWRNKDDERKVWYYLDPQNCTQGPFSSIEMDSWNKAGYFTPGLMVKRGESNFVELKKLLVVYPDSPFSSISDLKPFEKEDTSSHSTENEDDDLLRSEHDSLEEEIEKRFEKDLLKPTLFDDVKKSKDNFVPLESPTSSSQPISSPYIVDSAPIERTGSPPYSSSAAPAAPAAPSLSSSTNTTAPFESLSQQPPQQPQPQSQQQQQMWQQQQQQQMWDSQLQNNNNNNSNNNNNNNNNNNMGMGNSNDQIYKFMLIQQLQMIQQKVIMYQQYINTLAHQQQQIQQQPQTPQTQSQLQHLQQQQQQTVQQSMVLQQKYMQIQYQIQQPFSPFQYQQQQPFQSQQILQHMFQQYQQSPFPQFQYQQQQPFSYPQQVEQHSEQVVQQTIESVEQSIIEQEQLQTQQTEQVVIEQQQEQQEHQQQEQEKPQEIQSQEIPLQEIQNDEPLAEEIIEQKPTETIIASTSIASQEITDNEVVWGKTSTIVESKNTTAQLKVQQEELKTPAEIEQQNSFESIEKSTSSSSLMEAPISMANPWAPTETAPKKKSLAEIQAEEREQKKKEMEEAKIRSIENNKTQPNNVMKWAGAGAPTWSVETGVRSLSLKDIQEEEIREKKESPIVDNASDFERKKPVSLSDVMREQAKEKEKKQQEQQQQQQPSPQEKPFNPWTVDEKKSYSPVTIGLSSQDSKNNSSKVSIRPSNNDVWSEQNTISSSSSTKPSLSVRGNAPSPVYTSNPNDFPTLNILPNKPTTIVKNSNPVSNIKKTTVTVPGQARPDFIKWCHQQLKALTNNDVTVITELLCSLKTESEIRECAKECLGYTSDVDNFINDYLLARSDEPGLTFESSSPVITIPIKKQPKSQTASTTASKQKKKK